MRGPRQQRRGKPRHQVRQQKRAEDRDAGDAIAAQQWVLNDAEPEDDEDGGKHSECQRGIAAYWVGTSEVKPHQDIGEAEAHEGKQTLLDVTGSVGEWVAAIERVVDLEKHQKRGENDTEG